MISKLFITLLACWSSLLLAAQPNLPAYMPDTAQRELIPIPQFAIWDAADTPNIKAAIAALKAGRFKVNTTDDLQNKNCWVAFNLIRARGKDNAQWIVSIGRNTYNAVFDAQTGAKYAENGIYLPKPQRSDKISFNFLQLPSTVDTAFTVLLYIHRDVESNELLSIALRSEESVLASNNNVLGWDLFFIGVFLAIVVYNATLYFFLKDKTYLYYVIYLIAVGCFVLNKTLFYYSTLNQFQIDAIVVTSIAIICWSYLRFFISFLQQPLQSTLLIRLINIGKVGLIFPPIISLYEAFIYATPYSEISIDNNLMAALASIFALGVYIYTFYAWSKGNKIALWLVIAQSGLMLGTAIIAGLYIYKELNATSDTIYESAVLKFRYAIILEALVLAVVLAYRYRVLQVSLAVKEEEKQQLLQQQINTIKTITEAKNKELEAKVMERTQALQISNIALKQSNATKDKLFSIIAHDLRSPIATFKQMIDLVNSGKLTMEEFEPLLPSLGHSISTLYNNTENLLEWARSQQQGISTNPKKFDLQILVNKVIGLTADIVAYKKIQFNLSVPSIQVVADEHQIEIVIRNLTVNAIKFSFEHGVIQITATVDGNMVKLSVIDTGIGISADKLQQLFTNGQQVRGVGTKGEKGIGLGLSICKEFVELNRGTITVDSEPGKGSTFTISLPVAP
ncbi:MAG: ATP-binding protein [Chitinophagaceae bacterium]